METHTELGLLEIRFPKRPEKRLKNDYFHRVSTIFINISFDKWFQKKGSTDRRFLIYYDNKKQSKIRKFEAETRLGLGSKKHYTPDVICGYMDAHFNAHVFCLEVYNGKYVDYVEKQLTLLF